MQTLELLAPAKNLECGIAAIDHGADDSKLHANSYHFLFLSFHTASSSFGEMQDSSTESFWLRPEFSSLKNRPAPRRRMPLSRA